MDFERLYGKLPNFIRYNKNVLNFFLSVAKRLRNTSKKSKQLESHQLLFDLLFTSCDIKMKGLSRDIQILYLELLKFVDNVCIKYDIDYWIDYGTLLGAVRHGGFIPWDDDIDISMMRKDYEKLIEVLPKEILKYPELKDNCGLTRCVEKHENYFKDFKSVYDVENENEDISLKTFSFLQFAWMKPYLKIDFFPKDYLEGDKLEIFDKEYLITKYKFNDKVKNGEVNFKEELEKRKSEIGLTNERTPYFTESLDVMTTSPVYIYETERTFPLKTILFEDYEFKCPNDIDHVLDVYYGKDYMKIPITIEHHNLKKFIENQFKNREEMEKCFEKSIRCLRKINKTFADTNIVK